MFVQVSKQKVMFYEKLLWVIVSHESTQHTNDSSKEKSLFNSLLIYAFMVHFAPIRGLKLLGRLIWDYVATEGENFSAERKIS